MVRTVWIGLICLIAICGLTAYKIGFAAPAKQQAASAERTVVLATAQIAPAIQIAPAAQAATIPQTPATRAVLAPSPVPALQAAPAPQTAPTAQAAPAPRAASVQDTPASSDNPTSSDDPAAKSDRLDVDYLQDLPKQTLVHTIPIVLSNPGVPAKVEPEKATPEKSSRTASRHWRSSYARLTRHHYRRQREVAQPPATEAKAAHTGGLLGWLRSASSAK